MGLVFMLKETTVKPANVPETVKRVEKLSVASVDTVASVAMQSTDLSKLEYLLPAASLELSG